MLCQIVLGPQYQNLLFLMLCLTLRKASKNFDSYLKISTKTFALNDF